MKYFQPQSVSEAVEIAHTSETVFLAGGTDLVLHMTTGKVQPNALIDLGKISELREIKETDGYLDIGSMATFAEIGQNNLVFQNAFALWLIPTALDVPNIEAFFVEDPEYTGPFGAKGLGEPAMLPTVAAVINAIDDAVGVRITSLPATPEKILQALVREEGGIGVS